MRLGFTDSDTAAGGEEAVGLDVGKAEWAPPKRGPPGDQDRSDSIGRSQTVSSVPLGG
jgi:hypothetical protein